MQISSSSNQNPKHQVLRSPGKSRVGQRKGDSISTNRPVGWLLEGSHQLPTLEVALWDVLSKNQQRVCAWSARAAPSPGNNCFAFWTMTYHSPFFGVILNRGFSVQHARMLAISTRALLTSQTSAGASSIGLSWASILNQPSALNALAGTPRLAAYPPQNKPITGLRDCCWSAIGHTGPGSRLPSTLGSLSP